MKLLLVILSVFTLSSQLISQRYETLNLKTKTNEINLNYKIDNASIILNKNELQDFLVSKINNKDTSTSLLRIGINNLTNELKENKSMVIKHYLNYNNDSINKAIKGKYNKNNPIIKSIIVWEFVKNKILSNNFKLIYKEKYLSTIIKQTDIEWADFGNGMTGGGTSYYTYRTLSNKILFSIK